MGCLDFFWFNLWLIFLASQFNNLKLLLHLTFSSYQLGAAFKIEPSSHFWRYNTAIIFLVISYILYEPSAGKPTPTPQAVSLQLDFFSTFLIFKLYWEGGGICLDIYNIIVPNKFHIGFSIIKKGFIITDTHFEALKKY